MRLCQVVHVCFLFAACSPFSFAQLCQTWSGETLGELDAAVLAEASGLSVSKLDPKRLYSVSDSDAPHFYTSELGGSSLQLVRIGKLGNRSRDIEDLDTGPCGLGSCLFYGDIGGNNRIRDDIYIVVLEELASFPERVEPVHVLNLTYPDGTHDAEGLAVHPDGDIYVLTKEDISVLGFGAARLYRTKAPPWPKAGQVLPMELVATLDLRKLSGAPLDLFSHTATALDIAPSGDRFMVLTYGDAFEFQLDLSTLASGSVREIGPDVPFTKIPLERLIQQEGLSYLEDAYGFVYTTEARGGSSPLVRFECSE